MTPPSNIKWVKDKTIKFSNFISIVIAGLLGCTYHNMEPLVPCSCDYPAHKTFEASPTIMLSTTDGFLLLNIIDGFYKVCNDMKPTLLTDGLMVLANGTLKTSCPKADPYYGYLFLQESYVQLNSWTIPKDTIFNTTTAEIHIIRSEDYGYPPGFGFKIESIKGDYFAPNIPAVAGYKSFKTRTDAFKVAAYLLYKLYLKQPLPLTPQDLVFLKIDLS